MNKNTDLSNSDLLRENEERVLAITTKYMRFVILTFALIYLGNIFHIFKISYVALTIATVASAVILWLPSLAEKLNVPLKARRYICVLGLEAVVGILACNSDIGIYITYMLAMVTSLIFFDKFFTLQVSLINFFVIVASMYVRSLSVVQVEFESNLIWWISRCMGFLIESIIMTLICYNVAKASCNVLTKFIQSQKELKEKNEAIEKMSEQVIHALSNTIDIKDSYTNGHSNRVAEYSREIARRMGKSEEEISTVYRTALLHDVGKVVIADEIINKPGKLNDEEYAKIKEHTAIGSKILDEITEIPELSSGAHWHHERFDGKGYPDGLSGEQISEYARIICVADCYDAMTSNRSYRKVMPQETVRREIEDGMGTQFDPEVAMIMLQMIDEDTDYKMREL